MAHSSQLVGFFSTANSLDFHERTSLSAQRKILCSSIALIVLGVLLVLSSLVAACILPSFGILSPALALLTIPTLLGVILIVLGMCHLHTHRKILEPRFITVSSQEVADIEKEEREREAAEKARIEGTQAMLLPRTQAIVIPEPRLPSSVPGKKPQLFPKPTLLSQSHQSKKSNS